jgi:hypothetical protein
MPEAVEAEPARERGDRAEQCDRARRMIPPLVVPDPDTLGEFRPDLQPDDVGIDEIPAGDRRIVALGDECRHDDGGRMAGHHRQHVVEIERRPEGSADQRRGRCAGGGIGSDERHGALPHARDIVEHRPGDLTACPREDHRHRIDDDTLGKFDGIRAGILDVGILHELGETERKIDSHGIFLVLTRLGGLSPPIRRRCWRP